MITLLEHFHFLRPWAFLLILPLAWLLYRLHQSQASLAAWKKICAPALFAYLKVGSAQKASSWSLWAVGLAALLMITALAGPVWQQLPQPMYRAQSALVIMLDLSRSMDATDVKPSRLTRAKQKITDLLSLRHAGQTALVVFAGSAFAVTPLTEDTATILLQLQGLQTDIMPLQGGNIDRGIAKAIDLLRQASVQHGQIVLFTDSDDFSPSMLQTLTTAGHDLSVIAVGTALGAPILQASGGFLTNQQGEIVMPQLDVARLQSLAKLGHGLYRPLSLDHRDIQPIIDRVSMHNWHDNPQTSPQTNDQWREEGPWLLLALIPLVLLGFQRGALVVTLVATCGLLLNPAPVQAAIWSDWWQTKDQQAQALMQEENYAQASQMFEHQAWKAAAAYRNHDYTAALQALKRIEKPSVDDQYNIANTLAQLERLDQAIAMYQHVLTQEPNHQDAQANLTLLQQLKQQQEQAENNQASNDDASKSKTAQQRNKGKPDQPSTSQPEDKANDNGNNQGQSNQPNVSDQPEQAQQQSQSGDENTPKQTNAEQDNGEQAREQQASPSQAEPTSEQAAQNTEDKQPLEAKKDKSLHEGQAQTEEQQAFEYQLRRVPDDPARLWRNKFKYQYQQQGNRQQGQGKPW